MYPILNVPVIGNIPIFYLAISLALLLALMFIHGREDRLQLSTAELSNLNLLLMIGSFLGARLLHILYEEPLHYLKFPMEIFYIWQGGFVFFGGFALAFVLGLTYLRRSLKLKTADILKVMDFYALPAALVYAIGRVGCFLNGCCLGMQSSSFLAVGGKIPVQLMTSTLELGIFFVCLVSERKKTLQPGTVFFLWLGLHSLNRIFMETLRVDFRGPVLLVSLSTWISLGLLAIALHQLTKPTPVSE